MIGSRQREAFFRILGASVVLHLGAVMLFFVIADAHSKPEPKNIIATKLVRLGKERPKDMLPRLAKASTATGSDSKTAAETGQRKACAADAAKTKANTQDDQEGTPKKVPQKSQSLKRLLLPSRRSATL